MNFDIVVIGGNPAGSTAAVTAKKWIRINLFLLFAKNQSRWYLVVSPIPLEHFDNIEDDIKPITGAQKGRCWIFVNEVVSVDANQKD